VPVETCIIQHPKVWEASGHVGGFNDPMVDCRETKNRYRYDHVSVFVPASGDAGDKPRFAYMKDSPSEAKQQKTEAKRQKTAHEGRPTVTPENFQGTFTKHDLGVDEDEVY
jgi:glycyl-tRNA synthetase